MLHHCEIEATLTVLAKRAVYGPSRVEKNPTLILSAALADPAKLDAARPIANAIPMEFCILCSFPVSACLYGSCGGNRGECQLIAQLLTPDRRTTKA
jgi:hypothetical protein